ncbi:phage major tail protein, TP901-1 family [Enterococcus mediterraneensis]|uniref:phage major tail protein, TP901-1 family n=1 Tax=Enterococcus mediterraneensis TaxID=2364791 RepID=UPI000F0662EB|nr:phage major tail protein, TP901-1 family [Enterococcus mediterraneensis]
MAELTAVQGIDVILLFRILKEATENPATKLAFQTEHELTETSDTESTATKDGPVNGNGTSETEISCTSILARDDEMVKKLRQARRDGDIIEIWEVDVKDKDTQGKYGATYFRGKVTEFSKKPAAEGLTEVSLTFKIDGEGQDGRATLTAEQEEVVQYQFEDTTVRTVPEG